MITTLGNMSGAFISKEPGVETTGLISKGSLAAGSST